VTAVDASVVIAACAAWHEAHEAARKALARRPRLVTHCVLKAYSVLTRLPPPHRVPASLIVAFLDDRFPDDPLTLDRRAEPTYRRCGVGYELLADVA
jgi:hypothetical protein